MTTFTRPPFLAPATSNASCALSRGKRWVIICLKSMAPDDTIDNANGNLKEYIVRIVTVCQHMGFLIKKRVGRDDLYMYVSVLDVDSYIREAIHTEAKAQKQNVFHLIPPPPHPPGFPLPSPEKHHQEQHRREWRAEATA